jgi:hypothetical protein
MTFASANVITTIHPSLCLAVPNVRPLHVDALGPPTLKFGKAGRSGGCGLRPGPCRPALITVALGKLPRRAQDLNPSAGVVPVRGCEVALGAMPSQ